MSHWDVEHWKLFFITAGIVLAIVVVAMAIQRWDDHDKGGTRK